MKIKIALLGLFFANSIIYPIYADEYGPQLEADKVNINPIIQQDDVSVKGAQEEQSKDLIKLGATITMGPAIVYQEKRWSSQNSIGANLTFKAEVPNAWWNKSAVFNIATSCKGKEITLGSATVTIGKMTTIGYTSTILSYEKADGDLLVSAAGTVLQIKNVHTFGWLRIGYAIEKPIALQVGWFDKNQLEEKKSASEEKEEKKEEVTIGKKEEKKPEEPKGGSRLNKVDTSEHKERFFKIHNSFPSAGVNLSVVTDNLNIGLSILGRLSDYTHSTDLDAQNLPHQFGRTYGAHLGVQYQVIPKKFTIIGQGAYVNGLGDYLSGLAGIQSNGERAEMCAAYYIDKKKNHLSFIGAWGAGAALSYYVTPKWELSIRGSYLATLEDPQRPPIAFRNQWNFIPKVAYKFNDHFTFSGRYDIGEEYRVDKTKNKGAVHKFSGSIKFNL
ncbi:hypothetical protein ACRRVA_02160 [Candidatus Cardinium hertigii]|uniref:hypothetical protein n=1 Tax=Candidatus Cardinium hertigii TaxID=247481 RepID=UPI003D7E03D9